MWKNLCELWDDIHSNNLHSIRVPEGEEREEGTEIVLKEISGKLHIWWDLGMQVHVANRSPLRIHSKWSSPRHTVYNQDKETILEASREKQMLTKKKFPYEYQWISRKKTGNLGEKGIIYSNWWK